MPEKPDDISKAARQHVEMASAWDERKRTFDRLRDLRLTDEDRTAALEEYRAASKLFDDARATTLKK